MHTPYSAVTIILFGLAAVLLIAAAAKWVKLAKDHAGFSARPAIPVHSFRAAAALTAVALGTLGAALLWFALIVLEQA